MIELAYQDIALRLIIAAALGVAIGIERERVEQPAGLRDHALVALGSCLIMIVSGYGFRQVIHAPDVVLDPSRIASSVITGIGFIGAGTIVLRQNVVRGLTTAASVWSAAALGLACGGGLYFTAIFAAVLMLAILSGIKSMEKRLSRRYRRNVTSLIVQRDSITLKDVQSIAEEIGVNLERVDIRSAKNIPKCDHIDLSITQSSPAKLTALIDAFRGRPGVESLRSTILEPGTKHLGTSSR